MPTPTSQFLDRCRELIDAVAGQESAIHQAADWFSATILAGRMVHVFGAGHSRIMVEEMSASARFGLDLDQIERGARRHALGVFAAAIAYPGRHARPDRDHHEFQRRLRASHPAAGCACAAFLRARGRFGSGWSHSCSRL